LEFLGFALSDCTVNVNQEAARYLRVVHRTALELAVQNQFGTDVGGYWLLADQIEQLRKLPLYYSNNESVLVQTAIEAYLVAQIANIAIVEKALLSTCNQLGLFFTFPTGNDKSNPQDDHRSAR
jgi:hypothetical protein